MQTQMVKVRDIVAGMIYAPGTVRHWVATGDARQVHGRPSVAVSVDVEYFDQGDHRTRSWSDADHELEMEVERDA